MKSLALFLALLPAPAWAMRGGDLLTPAEAAEYGAVVVQFTGGSVCSGTLFEDDSVVTAAHCFVGEHGRERPVKVDFLAASGRVSRSVVGGEPHGSFRRGGFDPTRRFSPNDIGIVVFEGRAPAGYRQLPLLRDRRPQVFQGLAAGVLAVGAGRTESSEEQGVLHAIGQEVGEVRPDFRAFLADSGGSSGTCEGDSGGGGLVQIGDRLVLAGVISASAFSDCSDAAGTAYANVAFYVEWLEWERGRIRTLIPERPRLDADRAGRRMDDLVRRWRP